MAELDSMPRGSAPATRWDRRATSVAILALGLAAVLLICLAVVLSPARRETRVGSDRIAPASDARLIFTIRQGQGLSGHVGYDEAIDVAQRFSLPVLEDRRRIGYAEARDPHIDRLRVNVLVQPGDRFDLNGPPSAWTFHPPSPRAKARG